MVGSAGRQATDIARSDQASAKDHTLQGPNEEMMLRRLSDGREYHIVKHWFEADVLRRQLTELDWNAHIQTTPEFFVYGHATPAS